jgi:3-oxoacyl-[acyl-carrier-protein] synthase-3
MQQGIPRISDLQEFPVTTKDTTPENFVDFSDRRSFPRTLASNLFCKITISGRPTDIDADVLNIGSRGVMISINDELTLSSSVSIHLFLPSPFGEITLKGVVSWVEKGQNKYLCGIDFVEKKAGKNIETLRAYTASIIKESNIIGRRKGREPERQFSDRHVEQRVNKVQFKISDKPVSKQRMIPLSILGTGFYVPDKIITNKDYEEQYGVSADWIFKSTGIKERRMVSKSQSISDLATNAAKRAIKNAGISPQEIDLIILSSTCADYISPPTSCIIQKNLAATNASCFDIGAACMGYLWALNTAASYIGSNVFNTVLIISCDITSQARNFGSKATFHLLGDGAGAAILRRNDDNDSGVLSIHSGADGNNWNIATILGFMSRAKEPSAKLKYFNMEGLDIYKFAIEAIPHSIEMVMKKAGITKDDVKLVIPHQANIRILESAREKTGFPAEKFFYNIEKYGNTSSGTVSIALADAWSQGLIKKGDIIILVGFGSGLAWGATAIKV